MNKTFSFSVPGDLWEMSPNHRMNAMKRARLTKWWHQKSWLCWREAGAVSFKAKVRISLLVRRNSRKPMDVANAITAADKAIIDGVKGNGWLVVDDSPRWLEWGEVRFEKVKLGEREETVVTVEQVDG